MPFASNLGGLVLCGALWFMGAAIGGARIMALAIEQAPSERRGRAMASFSTAFPLSNGVGAFIDGLIVDFAGYRWMYTIAGLLCAMGFVLIWKQWAMLKRG
jgi:MFS family permease